MPVLVLASLVLQALLAQTAPADPQNDLGEPSFGVMTTDSGRTGASVARIFRDGPADRAGIRVGDMITRLNRVPIRSAGEFRQGLKTLSTDDATVVTIIRAAASVDVEVMAERAVPLYTRLCEVNDLAACATIGYMLAIGARVPRDPALAEDLLRTACDDGELTACLNLGYLLETGKLGSAEPGLAAAPYERACNAGVMKACINLGRLLRSGRGIPKDEARALELYRRACEADDVETCRVLGTIYLNGSGVTVDPVRARAFFRRACELGDEVACARAKDVR